MNPTEKNMDILEKIYDTADFLTDKISNLLCKEYFNFKGNFDVNYNHYTKMITFVLNVDVIAGFTFDFHIKLEIPRCEILTENININIVIDHMYHYFRNTIDENFLGNIKKLDKPKE